MKQPIKTDELMERVSGNVEFIDLMMNTFFNSREERLSAIHRAYEERNYDELADLAHKLKGVVGNLSITKAFEILKELHVEARLKNDRRISRLIGQLEKSILEAESFFKTNPIFKPQKH